MLLLFLALVRIVRRRVCATCCWWSLSFVDRGTLMINQLDINRAIRYIFSVKMSGIAIDLV